MSASQAEVLGGIIQSLHVHSRDLKGTQEVVFVDPLKRCCTELTTSSSLMLLHFCRLINVYKQVELQAKQREQKLQVCRPISVTYSKP